MKKTMTMISKPQRLMATLLLLTSLNAAAQTEVTAGVMRGKDYGVTNKQPKTEIEITLQITKHQRFRRTGNPLDIGQYPDEHRRHTRQGECLFCQTERQNRSSPHGTDRRRHCLLYQHAFQRT